MQNFSLSDEIFDRACHVFDRHFRIDSVLVVEINAVGSKALERVLDHSLDVLRSAIESTGRLSICIELKPELTRDNDFVAERRERFSDKLFACIGAVNFGGIEEGDAFFMGCTNDLDAPWFLSAGGP